MTMLNAHLHADTVILFDWRVGYFRHTTVHQESLTVIYND